MGGAALLTAPEPSSKVAAGLLFIHGTDTAAAGINTLTSGTVKQTVLAQTGEFVAKKLDAPPGIVKATGVVADMLPSLGAGGIVAVNGALNSTRLSRLMVPTPGTFTWGRAAATEIIVPVPRAAHLAKDVADLYQDAVMLAAERGARVVPLDQIANYPNATKVVFFGHANQFTLGGLQADDLNTVLVNAGLRPDIIELAGCSTGASIGRLEGVVTRYLQRIEQPLAPGVVSLSGRPVTAYTGPISVRSELLNNGGLPTAAFGEWHSLWGGGRLYSEADQIFFKPPPSGP